MGGLFSGGLLFGGACHRNFTVSHHVPIKNQGLTSVEQVLLTGQLAGLRIGRYFPIIFSRRRPISRDTPTMSDFVRVFK